MWYFRLIYFLIIFASVNCFAEPKQDFPLYRLPGFFHFSFDNIKMPENIADMGLLGANYFAEITPHIYGGVGGYGALTGTQGGLFVLGAAAGWRYSFTEHIASDLSFFAGGGGGRSSLVGGGLMIRPSLGLTYALPLFRVGLHYSYIDFPDGKIHSQQIGIDLDIPTEFYYLKPHTANAWKILPTLNGVYLPNHHLPGFQRNDFAILLQAYKQRAGTLNTDNELQDGTIGLIGIEFDHYFLNDLFWWIKASGAFSGIPNGYMDALIGLGYSQSLGSNFAIVPQFGLGAGGGGKVDTGGGFLINPLLGMEWKIVKSFSMRISSGYLWSPNRELNAVPLAGELIYHLNNATNQGRVPNKEDAYEIQGWRFQLLNQTYFHPQRTYDKDSAINLIGLQVDQLFSPVFFLSYQGMFAYSGYHSGGYATGMIGPGIQSTEIFNERLQFFAEMLVGAGGGGSLALGGGALVEPMIGVHYALTPFIGLQISASQIKAIHHNLNTPAFNVGLTIRFDTLNRI